MKIKLDENLPRSAATALRRLGHDVDTVLDERLGGSADPIVFSAAQSEGRFLVTQDLDFSNVNQFRPGSHFGVMLVRLPESEQTRIAAYLHTWFLENELCAWERCFVVATRSKIRVLRPRD